MSRGLCAAVQVEVPQTGRLLAQLEELSCSCSHQLSYTSAAKCFAGLVNKSPPGSFVFSLSSPPWFFCLSFSPRASIECVGLGSSGDSLDRLIQGTLTRVCSQLDSASSPLRPQALTLIIWVRLSVSASGSNRLFGFSHTVTLRNHRAVKILNNGIAV